MKLVNRPFIVITLATILGILIGYHFHIDVTTSLYLLISILGVLSCVWWLLKKRSRQSFYFTIIAIILCISFGATLVQLHDPTNYNNHYSHHQPIQHQENEIPSIYFSIKERLKPSPYYEKYIVSLRSINEQAVQGNLLLRIPKDSTNAILAVGEIYTTIGKLTPIPKALNPYQFDYADYLNKLYIYHQITIPDKHLIAHTKKNVSLLRFADQIRQHIYKKVSSYSFTTEQLAIINALLLGQRQDISSDTLNAYRDAGAIHILAISGLHVGILLGILHIMLLPILRIKKYGRVIKLVLSIVLLWCFALIAGLSPSVLRAVTMFSFLAIGIRLRSYYSSYNSLFISMFILLCYKPLLLFSVGFQLSYLAVFSILWIQPILANFYHPSFYVSKRIWEIFTVTISAQLGVLPLSLFYFHLFPSLFFVSNLMIIPFLGYILGMGILIIVLACSNILPDILVSIYGSIIDSMNMLIAWVASQDIFLIQNIHFSGAMLLSTYLILITLVLFLSSRKKQWLYWMGSTLCIFLSIYGFEKYTAHKREELVIFNTIGETTIGVLHQQKSSIHLQGPEISASTKNFLLKNYSTETQSEVSYNPNLKNIYQYKTKRIFIIDSSGVYKISNFKPDILVLTNSPKINLNRALEHLQPKQVIVDGSNYQRDIQLWKNTCDLKNIPFHNTRTDGAFILRH